MTAIDDGPSQGSRAAPVLERVFPKALDNRYRGHAVALWIFGLLVVFKAMISLVSLADPARGYAADGIPLNTYSPAAAQAVIGVGAYLDVELLMLVLLFVLALVRYRAMVPLMYVVLAIEFLAHRGAGLWRPIARIGGSSASFTTLGVFALTLIGLALAVTGRGYRAKADEVSSSA
ncbi:MAG TPA: hypothetical protein VGG92_00840 [Caulobacteraceae bacterium]|jgi:hypothetical protein